MKRSDFDTGFLLGLLVGQGSFTGDGKNPHIAIRMNVRHMRLLEHLRSLVPGSRLYGPYHHGGRHYSMLVIRGPALDELLPELDRVAELDDHAARRLARMRERYGLLSPRS